jgi:ADP-ribose pyrophosphatase YjhB (NUDIX family)
MLISSINLIGLMHNPSKGNYIPQISIDCVIFGYQNRKLKVLVSKLAYNGNFFALPSGFVYENENVEDAPARIIRLRTGLKEVYLEQFYVFGDAKRNSTTFINRLLHANPQLKNNSVKQLQEIEWFTRRHISIGFYALLDINEVVPQKSELDASIEWYDVNELPIMIIDHNKIVSKAIETLRSKLDTNLLSFNLLPKKFTMKDLQEVYETVLDKPFARNNFQKKILDLNVLARLDKRYTGSANKAPYLYSIIKDK